MRLPTTAVLIASYWLAACAPRQPIDLSDPAVNARVKSAIKAEPSLSGIRYLEVSTHQGTVTISGLVESMDQKRTISKLVTRVKGVRQVIPNIAIQE